VENLYNNPIVVKIMDGTPRSDVNLCRTCRNCKITVGALTGKETYTCRVFYERIEDRTEPASSCNKYDDKRQPSIENMEEIAWTLHADKGGRKVGFLSPEELKKKEDRI
jgi:hypothetical protein